MKLYCIILILNIFLVLFIYLGFLIDGGEKQTEFTYELCPSKVFISFPVSLFQSLIVLSSEPDNISSPPLK